MVLTSVLINKLKLNKMNETQNKIANRSEKIQDELHEIINQAKEQYPNSKAEYQDYVATFLISRIAALEIALEELKRTNYENFKKNINNS